MKVYLSYNNSHLNEWWTCSDIKFVPGFVVMEHAISDYGPPTDTPPKIIAMPTENIVGVQVYDE